MNTLRIVFLGTGAAVPSRDRSLPSIALQVDGSILLFDAGEGAQHRMVEAGLSPVRVEAVFITHLHGDHVFGLPGLLQTMAMMGRRSPLRIYGPPGLEGFVRAAVELSSRNPHNPGFRVELVLGDRLRHESRGYTVESFPVEHSPGSMGYVFREHDKPGRVDLARLRGLGLEPGPYLRLLKEGRPARVGGRLVRPEDVLGPARRGRVVVYTGDTLPSRRVVEAARGADVLIHDATFTHDLAEEAHEKGHATAREAAEVAAEAGVSMLVLTHISARYRDAGPLYREACSVFPFTLVAYDHMVLAIKPR